MKIDAYRVSAVFENGDTIDNDITAVNGDLERMVQSEIAETNEWHDGQPTAFLVNYYADGEIVSTETVPNEHTKGKTYKVVDAEGYTIAETDDVPDVLEIVYSHDEAVVLKLGADGKYHVDETDW